MSQDRNPVSFPGRGVKSLHRLAACLWWHSPFTGPRCPHLDYQAGLIADCAHTVPTR